MKPHTPWWRRKYYVHPIQRKYFFLSLVPLVFCAFLLVLVVFAPLRLAQWDAAADVDKMAFLGRLYTVQGIRIWLAVIASMLACSVHSFYVTHKFAGPLYRIEQILRRVQEGDLPLSFRIRRGDDLQDFVRVLDSAFRTIASALTAIKEQQALAEKKLATVHGKAKAGLNGEILEGLEAIGRNLKEVEKILATFRLPALPTPKPESTEG